MVFDGRLRQAPSETRPFSLYFALTRAAEGGDSQINMINGFTKLTLSDTISVAFPWGTKSEVRPGTLPEIPVVCNNKTLPKHVRLVCSRDLDLQRIDTKLAQKRVAELSKQKAAGKKAKTEVGDS